MFNLLASNVPFFYLGRLLVKLFFFFPHLHKSSASSCPRARNVCFLRSQGLILSPRVPGTTGGKCGLGSWDVRGKPIRRPRPGPLDPKSPSSSLDLSWLPENAPRCTVHEAWSARRASGPQPAVHRQLLRSLSHPLQAVNAESTDTETQTVPTVPLGEGGEAWPCQSHSLCK